MTGDKVELNHAIRLNFKLANNETEYKAVLMNLAVAEASGGKEVEIRVDLQVVVGQIIGEYSKKGQKLIKYLHHVQDECSRLQHF